MSRAAVLLAALLLPVAASGQERSNSILVLDGSGSMWGQIDGVNKIVIAREVVADLLADFPDDRNLGLTVYGHRTEGDCSDIQTIVEPGPDTAQSIIEAVNGINPRGKTPMTDAVAAAAGVLGYTEDPASVILVSDGIETCNPDPCAAARALEEAGADFTVHVVGFDVTDAEAIGQLQCLAEETGGAFLSASNADELTAALTEVAVNVPEPEPEPELTPVMFVATKGEDGPRITEGLSWSVTPPPDGEVSAFGESTLNFDLEAGAYTAAATWAETGQVVTEDISVLGPAARVVTLVFDAPMPTATLIAPETAVAGSTLEIAWEGPGEEGDAIVSGNPGRGTYKTRINLEGSAPARLRVPSQPGDYELRYLAANGEVLPETRMLTVTPAEATLVAPDTAIAGDTVEVAWEGPDYRPDYIAVSEPGEPTHINYALTREGSPLDLVMPVEPGSYELRYVMQQDREVIATRPIEVTDVPATLTAPETAVAGSTVEVAWDGPDYENDFLTVNRIGDDRSINYAYTRDGQPADLLMPPEPGEYEISYVVNQDRRALATVPISVTPVEARLELQTEASVGSDIEVAWEGPDYANDYIAVSVPDDDGYEGYTYTREGSPLDLTLPTEPGTYEVRYVLGQDRVVIAREVIELTDVAARLTAPAEAVAGSDIEVAWEGPDYRNDYIGVSVPDEDGYEAYTYTREGSPLDLTLPTEPGEYELRYYVGQDRTVLAAVPITVTEVGAGLEAPVTAVAGADVSVTWTGPDYQNDFISVARPDEDRYVNYTYTREGSPLDLQMPSEAGEYELRYQIGQGSGVLASVPITVEEVEATLTVPTSANVGETLEVTWTGPDYGNDYIGVAEPDEDRYVNYTYTREGAPLELLMPSEPGSYEVRYYMNQDSRILSRVTVEVADVTVSLTAPDTAVAGSEIEVGHDGPEYHNDYLSIAPVGAEKYVTYVYVGRDDPPRIDVPEEPGEYEIRYVMNQDRRVLGAVPLTVTAE